MNTALPVLGFALCIAALVVVLLVVVKPWGAAISEARRRPFGDSSKSSLTSFTDSTVAVLDKTVGGGPYSRSRLEDAGLRMPPSNFLILVVAASAVMALAGMLLSGPALAIILAVMAPLLSWLALSLLADRRKAKFDQQLGDNLMLITGGLRAGHSVLAALDAAAKEAESPASEEFSRVVNEVRIGRDLDVALSETANRMKSDDFSWVSQAIQINRDVGGDLAEVLDHVAETIRERGEIKAQVQALSAEGKLSGIILVALPFVMALMLMVVNPTYLGVLFTNPVGWVMLAVGAVMMIIGSLWMRKTIQIKF
ncbi:type II secretion system F family protein [Arthrobacter glacialis]|uniref:Type II secretion system protein F n=1 Tax=Arthrobacter glacialis TaxID=1664 RepID=A0A2S4A031_ARTGL|nr:type II secretion system F family protein [Arthrobacter glacialis]POH60721.1 type II secretion system protein F [Arthrobacter glacialis]POH74850.1 type II secretion system protein F [Arthrobacter glacialis]